MKLTFGKYKGMTIEQVMSIEPDYIGWAIEAGIIVVDEETKSTALYELKKERAYTECWFEQHHGDWGNRD